MITIGIYALSGFEVTPATVTGLLTILGFSLYDTVVVFDKVRENTRNLRQSRQTYAEAANLAVNQTLVRSINTSIVALLPVGAILYVGAVQLGSGPLKDLALALFVGMAAGAYSSIFIATPLLAQLKSRETGVHGAGRSGSRRAARRDADRYAAVPAFTDDIADRGRRRRRPRPVRRAHSRCQPVRCGSRPVPSTEALGRGRVVPPSPRAGGAEPGRPGAPSPAVSRAPSAGKK